LPSSPWIFTQDTAIMFYNKHSFCENIPTLTNQPTTVVRFCASLRKVAGMIKTSWDLDTNFFAQK